MSKKSLEAILRLPARELVDEIEKVQTVEVLDAIEFAEMQREEERKGSGRTTVFNAIASRRAELADERRDPDQDAAVETAFVEGTLPEEDRREPVPDPSPSNPMTLSELGRTLDAPVPGTEEPKKRKPAPAQSAESLQVRAKSRGFYGGQRIRAGVEFTIESAKQLAPWMELVGDVVPSEELEAAPSGPAADDSSVI